MRPDVQTFFDPATFTATHLVVDPLARVAAVVDPVLDFDPKAARISTSSADAILSVLQARGLRLIYILETHAHADHLSAASYLRDRTGATVTIGVHIRKVQQHFIPMFEIDDVAADGGVFDHLLDEGDTLPLGRFTISVLHTPGHTPADVTYRIGDAAFVGDTLFMPDYGTARADFPGGDARTLYRSIRKLMDLPAETRLFVGHDYLPAGREAYRWETSVAEQRADNVQVHLGIDEDAFVAMREARD